MHRRFYALGRLRKGQRNKTEAAYEKHLELLLHAGEIWWYRFEAIKLRLADNTFLTMDFAVINNQGQLELHDVKPTKRLVMEDANVKLKVGAEQYPFIFKKIWPLKGSNLTQWESETL